jgi:hypothetical protein
MTHDFSGEEGMLDILALDARDDFVNLSHASSARGQGAYLPCIERIGWASLATIYQMLQGGAQDHTVCVAPPLPLLLAQLQRVHA